MLQIEVDGTQYLVTKEILGVGGFLLDKIKCTAGQTTTFNITVKGNELDVRLIIQKTSVGARRATPAAEK